MNNEPTKEQRGSAAYSLLRELVRQRVETLLQVQDSAHSAVSIYPTSQLEVEIVERYLKMAREAEIHEILVPVIAAVDEADSTNNKRLSKVLTPIYKAIRARSTRYPV